eukprot:TRINITY_DN6727_c0_g1_i2.p1 TRINITY_DN6727_c0_g1~~TRINITY_DN6727_c0_g1_i2.p1  ORF type:complete len:568 (+),score=105.36 TRINITY_DN6727_c0_g1_i2:208-1911(+)
MHDCLGASEVSKDEFMAAWPLPRRIAGLKSRRRAVFRISEEAEVAVNPDAGAKPLRAACDLQLTLESRVAVVGGEGLCRAIAALLEGACGEEKENEQQDGRRDGLLRQAGLHAVVLGPRAGSGGADVAAEVAEALRSRPQVVVLDEAYELGNGAWTRTFNDIVNSQAFMSFQGAIVVFVRRQTKLLATLCPETWVQIGNRVQAVPSCELSIEQDVIKAFALEQSCRSEYSLCEALPFVMDSELGDLIEEVRDSRKRAMVEPPYLAPPFSHTFSFPELGCLSVTQGGAPRRSENEAEQARKDCNPVLRAELLRLLDHDYEMGEDDDEEADDQDAEPFDWDLSCGKQPLSQVVREVTYIWQDQAFLPGFVEPTTVLLLEALVALRHNCLGRPHADEHATEHADMALPVRLESSPVLSCDHPRVLVLDAGGVGLPGIGAARLWPRGRLLLTDSEPGALPALRENFECNRPRDSEDPASRPQVGYAALTLGDARAATELLERRWGGDRPDLVLCSDVVRDGVIPDAAVKSLAGVCLDGNTLALIAVEKGQGEDQFLRNLAAEGDGCRSLLL